MRSRPTSRRPSSPRRPCSSCTGAARSSRTWNGFAVSYAPVATLSWKRSARELGGRVTWTTPAGGYFLWIDLPVEAAELLARAESRGVSFVKGSDFFPGPGGEQSARLAFSYASPSEIDEGVAVLASLV